jgi:uncharacterized protein
MKGGEKMKEMNICIDIDGTVTEPYYWLKEANRYFGKNVRPEDIKVYDIDIAMGIRPGDYDRLYSVAGERLHMDSEIRGGASEVISRLWDLNRIHFVTARDEAMRDVSADWLKKYDIPMDTLTLLGHSRKSGKAGELECDYFIEDSLSNAQELAEAGFKVLLIDCTYNKGLLMPGITRVKDWRQVEMFLKERMRERELMEIAV